MKEIKAQIRPVITKYGVRYYVIFPKRKEYLLSYQWTLNRSAEYFIKKCSNPDRIALFITPEKAYKKAKEVLGMYVEFEKVFL